MTFIAPLGRLLVVDAAGKLHVRKGPAWMPVKNVKDVFTTLGDVIPTTVYYVPQGDGGACHVGFRSCFYRVIENGELVERP